MKPILKKYISESHHIYTIDRLLGFSNLEDLTYSLGLILTYPIYIIVIVDKKN